MPRISPSKEVDDDDDEVAVPDVPPSASETARQLEKKWGAEAMRCGFTAIPNVLLTNQRKLGLSPLELAILAHLVKHWWRADDPPYPGKKRIADALHVDPRTVQRSMAAMESRGLLKREKQMSPTRGQKTNRYVLTGLVEKIRPYAQEMIRDKDEEKKTAAAKKKAGFKPKVTP